MNAIANSEPNATSWIAKVYKVTIVCLCSFVGLMVLDLAFFEPMKGPFGYPHSLLVYSTSERAEILRRREQIKAAYALLATLPEREVVWCLPEKHWNTLSRTQQSEWVAAIKLVYGLDVLPCRQTS